MLQLLYQSQIPNCPENGNNHHFLTMLQKMKSQTSVKMKINYYESTKHLPKIKTTTYSTEVTGEKAEQYLKIKKGKLESNCFFPS